MTSIPGNVLATFGAPGFLDAQGTMFQTNSRGSQASGSPAQPSLPGKSVFQFLSLISIIIHCKWELLIFFN